MDTKAILAKNIKEARSRLGLSQAKLAERARTSVAFIGEIEIGRKSPSLDNLGRIADALGMQVYQLFLLDSPSEVANRQAMLTDLKRELMAKITHTINDTIQDYLSK